MKIAVIGAGRMGGPIVERLRAAGHEPTVLVRRAEAQAAAEAAGAPWAATVPDAVRDAQVVLTVVFDDDQLREVTLGENGALSAMPAGSILVQHTTCEPATVATLLAQVGAERGVSVLDAALSGTPRDIAAGQLTLWVGGEQARLDQVHPVLDTYAAPVMFVGPIGNGQRIKLVNNALFVSQLGLAIDAVRLGGSIGISEQQLLSAVEHGSGASRSLSIVSWIGASGVGTRLAEFMHKDIAAVLALAARSEADLGLIGDVLASEVVQQHVLSAGDAPPHSDVRPSPSLKNTSAEKDQP